MKKRSPSRFYRPWLWLPSRLAHDFAAFTLPLVSPFYKKQDCQWRPLHWRGLTFKNPLGIAGGVDKSGQSLKVWESLGCGFLEVGTVTPQKQGANPGKIMDRDFKTLSLWNKMGFPNPGVQFLLGQLKEKHFKVPLFINIGKNRWTENERAYLDYAQCIEALHPFADGFVINLSSPNTSGLRDLLEEKHLQQFLKNTAGQIEKLNVKKPVLLKLSPDMDKDDLIATLENSKEYVDGWILTNTTKSRFQGCSYPPNEGGVSGAPLQQLSLAALEIAAPIKSKNPDKLLVSVGGVMNAQDVKHRLERGADLVQCYSALVFEGPGFFHKVLSDLQDQRSR